MYDPELEEARRQLLRFRYSSDFKGPGRRVPVWGFARLVGVSRQALYDLMSRERRINFRPATRARLLAGIAAVNERGVRWRRRNCSWQPFFPNGKTLELASFALAAPDIAPPPGA